MLVFSYVFKRKPGKAKAVIVKFKTAHALKADIFDHIEVVVYLDLKGNSKLTSWTDSVRGEDE